MTHHQCRLYKVSGFPCITCQLGDCHTIITLFKQVASRKMGNCASAVNCTSTSQPVESDPDVAGIGVLVSFSATVMITFIPIIIGYLTDSLPDSTLSDLDRVCK